MTVTGSAEFGGGPRLAPESGVAAPERGTRDLALVAVCAVAATFVSGVAPAIGAPLGILAVIFLPGYALVSAILPDDAEIDRVTRIGVGIALSFAMMAILGLILNSLAGEITSANLRFSLCGVTLGFCLLAAARRARGAGALGAPTESERPARVQRAARFTQALIIANLAIAAVAYWLSVVSQPPMPTSFYVLGPTGQLSDYPRAAAPGAPISVRVGIEQSAGGGGRYSILAHSGETTLASRDDIALGAGQTYSEDLTLALDAPGDDQEIVIELRRAGETNAYRTLRLWVDVDASAAPRTSS